VHLSC